MDGIKKKRGRPRKNPQVDHEFTITIDQNDPEVEDFMADDIKDALPKRRGRRDLIDSDEDEDSTMLGKRNFQEQFIT